MACKTLSSFSPLPRTSTNVSNSVSLPTPVSSCKQEENENAVLGRTFFLLFKK